jgi:hypothetical protein
VDERAGAEGEVGIVVFDEDIEVVVGTREAWEVTASWSSAGAGYALVEFILETSLRDTRV